MKALIILLVIVGVSFIGLLVYGASRDEQPKRACERLPTFSADKDPDEDDLADWCPPDFAESTRGLQARFAPGLGQGTRTVEVGVGQFPTSLGVRADPDEEVRAAKLKLVSGSFAVVTGPKDATICMCAEGKPIPDQLRDRCQANWQRKHAGKSLCEAKFDSGVITFDEGGGTLGFLGAAQANVQVE